jgi:hypothetical protein
MPFVYDFTIDNQRVDVQIGFSTSEKWEEALDEASMIIPFAYQNKEPYKMFSMVNVTITEIDNYIDRNQIDSKELEYLVYSDRVESNGAYGYYKHNVNAIEYTSKLDYYILRSLARSRSVIDKTQAPFITHNNSGGPSSFVADVTLEYINVNATLRQGDNITFDEVYKAYIVDGGETSGYKRVDAVIATNATLISGTNYHVLSDSPATWVFPKGQWEIYYGFMAEGDEDPDFDVGFNKLYTFYVDVIEENELSVYDVINEIRSSVSKFGGLEDTRYYDTTRIFDIDPEYEDYLKQIQSPQIYLSNVTARQAVIYALTVVNALPRLKREEILDTLKIERYNLATGSFEREGVVSFGGVQNTNQIGTRNYMSISQGLTDDLDDPSITTPSRSGYQQVRSLDVQLTANNFAIKLPERSPLYMPKKLVVVIPYFKITSNGGLSTLVERTNFELDLTARWINGEEWKLKEITENFPDIETRSIWDRTLGLREWKVENLSWNIGDTEINLSTIFGTIFQTNLITNVVKMALFEYYMLHMPIPVGVGDIFFHQQTIDFELPSESEYKDWRFRVEYITDERLVVKQDKEDTSQVSFYSEMRQNQEESLVNIVRQSRKGYGDLQRTGNVSFSFVKKHRSLSEFYKYGMKDSDGYTITQIDTQWFNNDAIATYHVTRYHNRIQQTTFVNQKYRPFDNFAKNVLDRHEYYGDYLIAVPPNDTESGVQSQSTKIHKKETTVRRIVEILLGGEFGLPNKPTATVALVRTDGMFDIYPEGSSNVRNFISAPVTSRGIKGGFTFTFGFQSNQVAGDGLVSEQKASVTTYYNRAKRYTDGKGRFTRFGFAIMRDIEYDSDDYLSYPLITKPLTSFNTYYEENAYFSCGYPFSDRAYEHPLVWNKDPLTNANLTYGLNVLSHYVGLYVFGIKFFTDNFIVKEHQELNGARLYLYQDGTTYDMFEDIFVKSGYTNTVILRDDFYLGDGNIEYDPITNQVNFIGIDMTNVTSWAIGIPQDDGTIDLLVACNEPLNGIKFVNRHVRPNILEIGDRQLVEEWVELDAQLIFNEVDMVYFRSKDIGETIDFEVIFNGNIDFVRGDELEETIDFTINIGVDMLYFINDSVPFDINFGLEFAEDIQYYRSKDIGITLDLSFEFDTNLLYEVVKGQILDMTQELNVLFDISKEVDMTVNADIENVYTLEYHRSKDIGETIDFSTILNVDISFDRTKDIAETLDLGSILNVDFAYTAEHPKFANPTIEVVSYSSGTDAGGDFYTAIYRVRNNDSTTARVGHNITTTTPTFVTTNMIQLNSNEWSDYIEFGDYYSSPPNIVAQARDVLGEDDKEVSDVVIWNNW